MSDRSAISEWDNEAAGFDLEADHGLLDPTVRDAWSRMLLERLPPAPARVADLGCGTGTLTALLADEGYRVDGIDFSPRMVDRARAKTAGRAGVSVAVADAADPPLPAGEYDVVLCRHVLWALPDPAEALARWIGLLAPGGRLVLVEGSWSTGAGLTAAATESLVRATGRPAETTHLDDPAYWGRAIEDERYVVVSR